MDGASASNDSLDYERIGRFIYSFHRVCGSVEALNEIALARDAPQGLAVRAFGLVKMFERVVKKSQYIPESEITSALLEATVVQAEIDEWRSRKSRL
jgi:hypothetical protein